MSSFDLATLRDELIRDEALKLKPYKDTVGKTTIGIGRNLDDVGISHSEAVMLLDNDIQRTADALTAKLPWWQTLDAVRQRVMLNMAFIMGINSLLGFHNTLTMIQSGRYEDAAAGMLQSLLARQVGDRAKRLAQMMREGK